MTVLAAVVGHVSGSAIRQAVAPRVSSSRCQDALRILQRRGWILRGAACGDGKSFMWSRTADGDAAVEAAHAMASKAA